MLLTDISWSEVHKCCPKDIFPSRHLAERYVTVSGPKSSVKTFAEKLLEENVFTTEVESHGYALHSHHMNAVTESLRRNLEKILGNPKTRSSWWISSSYNESEWNSPTAKLADTCYFVHNLVSPILLSEALLHIPKNAVVIESSPYFSNSLITHEAECIKLFEKDMDPINSVLSCIGRSMSPPTGTKGPGPNHERHLPFTNFTQSAQLSTLKYTRSSSAKFRFRYPNAKM
ncbi:fatty acid synthase [Trichonephila clavipes]|nr:fatty acid synthase [Trichonephila clavipes]